jgi:hypothetical protein
LADFAEEVQEVNFSGHYDYDLQMFLSENGLFEVNHTVTETQTGGWNDTDSDTD